MVIADNDPDADNLKTVNLLENAMNNTGGKKSNFGQEIANSLSNLQGMKNSIGNINY